MKSLAWVLLVVTASLGCSHVGSQESVKGKSGKVVLLKRIPVDLPEASCEAKNEVGGKCTINCPDGEKAHCQDVSGGGTPICECLKQ